MILCKKKLYSTFIRVRPGPSSFEIKVSIFKSKLSLREQKEKFEEKVDNGTLTLNYE